MAQIGQPRAKQAVANLEAMVEKAERPIDRQRRKPQRELGEIDGLDPFSDPDYAPKVEALRRDYIEARLAQAEHETASDQPD